jgi:hypothetical protein
MLAHPVMGVVIALGEKITLGTRERVTAVDDPSWIKGPKVPQRRAC